MRSTRLLWLSSFMGFSICIAQQGVIIADSTQLFTNDVPGRGIFPMLHFGERVTLLGLPKRSPFRQDELIKVQTESHAIGWISAANIIYELSPDLYTVYIPADTIILYQQPSVQSPISARIRNQTYKEAESTYILPIVIQRKRQVDHWQLIKIDSSEGWIENSCVRHSAYLAFFDSAGNPTEKAPVPEIGVLKLFRTPSDPYIVAQGHSTLSLYNTKSRQFEKRFYLTDARTICFQPSSRFWIIHQSLDLGDAAHSLDRIFRFDPRQLQVKRGASFLGASWPRGTFLATPSGKNFYFATRRIPNPSIMPIETILRLDDSFAPVDSLMNEGNVSRQFTFLNDDTLIAVMMKRDQSIRSSHLGFFDVKNMRLIGEKDLARFFATDPFHLSFERVFFYQHSLFVYGLFKLRNDPTDKFRFIHIDLTNDDISEAPELSKILWAYTPTTIIDNILIFPLTNRAGESMIQEYTLSNLSLTRSVTLKIGRETIFPRHEAGKNLIVGDEGSGQYEDGIIKLDDGNYVILYSIHKD